MKISVQIRIVEDSKPDKFIRAQVALNQETIEARAGAIRDIIIMLAERVEIFYIKEKGGAEC